jgi:RNA polymerase-associated protein RTF1
MDMETSSESEGGQITKQDLEEEMYGTKKKTTDEDQTPATLEDLNKCRITRDMLSKWCMSPWFEEYVKGLCLSQNH